MDFSWLQDWRENTHSAIGPNGFINLDNPVQAGLLKVLILVPVLFQLVPIMIWLERRLLSWMQDRIGPNRTGSIPLGNWFPIKSMRGKRIGTFGLFQLLADGIKGFTKEDIIPGMVDKGMWFLAPALGVFPAFILSGTLPWGPAQGIYSQLTPVANLDVGMLYVLAVSSLGAYSLVLAGYSSNNKYSLMGGLRASAQLLSYELAMGMSAAAIIMASGSLQLTKVVSAQEQPLWGAVPWAQNWFIFTPFGMIAAVIFLICMTAETNRAPFDLPEAENELIAGYMTEYGSKKFLVFAMGEYVSMFTFSALFGVLFLGGYNMIPIRWDELAVMFPGGAGFFTFMSGANYWLAPLVILGKGMTGIFYFIWIRATLPRLRYDQLMNLGWKTLLPVGVANFVVVGFWMIATQKYGTMGGWATMLVGMVVLGLLFMGLAANSKSAMGGGARRKIRLVDTKGAP